MQATISKGYLRLSGILFAVVCAALFAGCENSCFLFVSNPGGTVPPPTTTCSVVKPAATVNLALHSGADFANAAASAATQHIFVTVRGVQAHPDEIAADDSPDWADLAPELAAQPVQVDLLKPAGNSCAAGSLGEHIVAPGVYRQVRLELVSSAPSAIAPRENACGSVGLHCTVSAAGVVRALAFDSDPPVIHIASDRISGGFIRILPDSHVMLAFEFDPYASTLRPASDAAHLASIFTLAARPSCNSAAP